MESTEDVISDEELDKRYRELIDSFIDHANELSAHNSIENVGLALLFAASRFNAYVVSQHAETKDSYAQDRIRAKTFFLEQYEQMLDENFDDYAQTYEKYSTFMRPQ